MNNLEELSKWYLNSELDFDRTLQELRYRTIRKYFKGKTCLEIAPAQGITTARLKDDFEVLHVVEGSLNLLNEIPEYPNVTKFHSFIENFNPPITYDFILMDHILEHIEEPQEALSKVKSFLNPRGTIIIGVPNAKSIHRLVAVKMGYLKSIYELNQRDRELGHYRVYDMDTLSKEILNSGLKIKKKEGVFFKPLSNGQIQENWDAKMIEGFYQLGFDFPENTAEIYIIAQL
ncbi:MAG TPA: methyltransferase domain-containing protein [Chitinophagaceae bacterium]|nr:methyltransferase domain-containing protein [Chitinophagaceae bacterium]